MTNDVAEAGEKSSLAQLEELISTDPERAVDELRKLLGGDPLNAAGYRLLARALQRREEESPAQGIRTTVRAADQLLARASAALEADDLETAEIILRRRTLERPDDADALYLLAQLAQLLDYDKESEDLLRLAIEIVPTFAVARVALARSLNKRNLAIEACEELKPVLETDPENFPARGLYAAAVSRAGEYEEAIRAYEEMLEKWPREPAVWSTYGYTLKTIGRAADAEAAMRKATELDPFMGEAWFYLSNMKTIRFSAGDIAKMLSALERTDLSDADRWNIHFALGKAFEDQNSAAEAFAHYERANAVRRRSTEYHPGRVKAEVEASMRVFTPDFFEKRAGWGAPDRDPIFVLGMPRAGSTLIEQILGSHPLVEGTKELPEIPIIAKDLGRGHPEYFRNLSEMSRDRARTLGEEYLERTRLQRKTDRPFFVDKMPNNWLHIPLIHLLLPNAKVIDARRHPLACGFSNFKQNYTEGFSFSYDLEGIGLHYRQYVRLMAHIDAVLPGRVHRVIHERLVDDTESEVRSMLDYLGLPFDAACLRFYETKRPVRTPSSEQVRRPISREGVEQWRKFETRLEPLKTALGSAVDAYPGVPDDLSS